MLCILDQLFYFQVQNILGKKIGNIQTELQQDRVYDTEVSKTSHCLVRPHKSCGILQAVVSINIKACCHQQPFWKKKEKTECRVSQFLKKQIFQQPPISPETAFRKT
jgi:hypothetical protein